ncbi:replication initiator [Actinopolymorpha pittospori]
MTHSTPTITPDTTTVPGAVAAAETPAAEAHFAVPSAIQRAGRDDYGRWLSHVHSAAGCSQPVRLAGRFRMATVDTSTGEITREGPEVSTSDMPDGVLYKACGNRRAAVCPSCAEIYRADAYQLVLAGLRGGKGVPDTVSGHPAVFATTTAPGFGIVHTTRTTKKGQPAPCRARRTPELCPHGVDLRCMRRHGDGDEQLGQPLCPDCYDYEHHAVWNAFAGELWRRTTIKANRMLHKWARHRGYAERIVDPETGKARWKTPVRISFGKVAEFQRRGLVHFHILARFDGIDFDNPEAVIPPPDWANSFLLSSILQFAVARTTYTTPALVVGDHRRRLLVDEPDGWHLAWGEQLDVRPVRMRGDDKLTDERVAAELDHHGRPRMLSGAAVAGYLAKYATKATEAVGHSSRRLTPSTVGLFANDTHPGRLIAACWRLSQRGLQTTSEWKDGKYYRLRRWAHMLGYGGHFFTKSRRYSATFRQLRQARIDWRRAHHESADHLEEHQVLAVIGELVYTGTGWHTTGDALLANTAAALAREQRQTGRLEIATNS